MDQQTLQNVNVQVEQPQVNPPQVQKFETGYTKTLKSKFMFFAPLTLAYAIFYTFCMYKNQGGITFPFFIAGTVAYLYLCVTKLGATFKKSSYFSLACAVLIGIATPLTGNEQFWFYNKCAIFMLVVSVALGQFYDTGNWGLGKYFTAFMRQCFGSFSCIIRPFTDAHEYNKDKPKGKSKTFLYVTLGILISIPLCVVVVSLLADADAVFRESVRMITELINVEDATAIAFRILWGFVGTYMFLAYICKKMVKEKTGDSKVFEPIIAITITSILSFIYILFSGIQIAYLFLGNLKLPTGYTYAQYAREGVFQLFGVSLINLVIVLICISIFRESKALNVILTIFTACTYIMIASSAMRMYMYVNAYYLSVDRILVIWALATMAILLVGVLVNIYKKDFKLFDFFRIVVTVCYIVLAFARPDYICAKVNLARPDYKDFSYIVELSSDAAEPVYEHLKSINFGFPEDGNIDTYQRILDSRNIFMYDHDIKEDEYGYAYIYRIADDTEGMTLRKFNFSLNRAMKLFGL
ncbi:MAG: DUF4173 domain-containing protein [Lachnospiraceae bacterium]|nr:DUF4173 domain-containing protein [Lachnospiraceae bacterium]